MTNTDNETHRGEPRERNLEKAAYYSTNYFQLKQLCSQAHQVRDIYMIKPKSIIEIGIGNGFTSSFLRQAGFEVTTVDINQNLSPDICCSIDELSSTLAGSKFDLVVCCEVLEHMPFDKYEANIRTFREVSDQLYLTLPNYSRSIGFGGFFKLPIFFREFSLYIDVPFPKRLDNEHFWEVGSSAETKKKNILHILKNYYPHVSQGQYALNPYHLSFTAIQ